MTDILVLAVVLAAVGSAMAYVIKSKKRGVKCIGCPDGHKCSGNCGSCGGCGGHM